MNLILDIFMMSFISSVETINVVVLNTSFADAAAVDPNDIKTLLANGLSALSIKANPVFSNGPKSLPWNPPDCPLLCNWDFNNFILADEPFAKALQCFETCVLVNTNLCVKLFSSLELPTASD